MPQSLPEIGFEIKNVEGLWIVATCIFALRIKRNIIAKRYLPGLKPNSSSNTISHATVWQALYNDRAQCSPRIEKKYFLQ